MPKSEKKVKVVVVSPFTDKENDYLLRTPKLNSEFEATAVRAQELIEKGKVRLAKEEETPKKCEEQNE